MKLSEVLSGVKHEVLREFSGEITQIAHDARKVAAGALFICLRGMTVDGHSFIAEAVGKGAAAVLVERDDLEFPQEIGIVKVENTRETMALIAANFHGNPARNLRLIGVTGTNGKTTTTYFIEEILRGCGLRTGLIGTVGLRALGRPLEIEFATDTTPDPSELHAIFAKMLELGVQDVVMEVSSHALALHKMTGLVFDVGVFTNLTQDHLDFHGTMENYRLAKAQLFAQSEIAVVNADDDSSATMLAHHGNGRSFSYAINTASDFTAVETSYGPQGSAFELNGLEFELPVSGKFNVYNALAAIATAHALEIDLPPICEAVKKLSGVPGRIQSVPNTRGLNIFVDYAHSPDGLENIIRTVRESTAGRVITLFGCGGDRDRTKRPIMGEIAARLSDFCILTSDNPRTENPFEILAQIEVGVKNQLLANPNRLKPLAYEIIENRREAIFAAVKMLEPADALIIAGKGHEDYQIIGTVKHHFDDFETAVEAVGE